MKIPSGGRVEELIFRHAPFDRNDLWLDFDKGDFYEEFLDNVATDIWEELAEDSDRTEDYLLALEGGASPEEIYGSKHGEFRRLVARRLEFLQRERRIEISIQQIKDVSEDRRVDMLLSCPNPTFFSRKTLTAEAIKIFIESHPKLPINNYDYHTRSHRSHLFKQILHCFNYKVSINEIEDEFIFTGKLFEIVSVSDVRKSISKSSEYQLLVKNCSSTLYVVSTGNDVDPSYDDGSSEIEYPYHDISVPWRVDSFIENLLEEDITKLLLGRLAEVSRFIDDGDDGLPF